jgi:hypothetical protein
MRWTVGISLALLILIGAYTVWPLISLYQLAAAVEDGNRAALAEKVDVPRLRRSLAEQIVAEYLKITGKTQNLGRFGTSAAVGIGATIADPIVERLLNLDTLSDLLKKGSVGGVASTGPLTTFAPLSSNALASVWRAWLNTEYSGTRFMISLPTDKAPFEQFRIRLDLNGWAWMFTGIELPEQLRIQLAQEIVRTHPS